MESEETRRLREALELSKQRDKKKLRLKVMRILNTLTCEEHEEVFRVLKNHYYLESQADDAARMRMPFDPQPPEQGEHGICQFEDSKCVICGWTDDDEEIDI